MAALVRYRRLLFASHASAFMQILSHAHARCRLQLLVLFGHVQTHVVTLSICTQAAGIAYLLVLRRLMSCTANAWGSLDAAVPHTHALLGGCPLCMLR